MSQQNQGEGSMYGHIKLFSGTGCIELAEEISTLLKVPLTGRDIIEYPNENLFVRLHESVRGQDAFIIQTTSSPVNRNIMELLILLDTLKRASAGRITAVIPYLAYARSDKKDQPRVPITARLIADLLTIAGADRYILVDLHAGQIQGFFSIPGDELTAFPILSDYYKNKHLKDEVVVSADLGFAKKARNFAVEQDAPLALVEKRRSSETGESEALTLVGDVEGKAAIIVDDEVDTGGSIVNAVRVVHDHGAREIYLSFTHALLSGSSLERLRNLPVKEIVTTNTVPLPPEKRLANMTILSIAPLLAGVIWRVHTGQSVGEMFTRYNTYA
jgi:ribose-phosphate pyrophosphokinase